LPLAIGNDERTVTESKLCAMVSDPHMLDQTDDA
jgi:hypothetical protein